MSQNKPRSKGGTTSPALKLVSVTQALLVGEYLSFRRVATVLGVRQSAVSRRVRELEDELGVSLFERHHAGVRVTNAGVRFLQEAREALLQLEHAVKIATAAGSGTIGRLNIGILSSIATGYLRVIVAMASAAARLLRTYAIQVETLRRLRNGGSQFVRVEHVHVNEGGQAVVGTLAVGRTRGAD